MEADSPAIEVQGLSRRFGIVNALEKVEFAVPRGEICGLIGPNGSGKTTLLRILATLLPPSAGEARVAGFGLRKEAVEVRQRIGYMPDTFGGYEEMPVDSYLEFFAHLYRLAENDTRGVVEDILGLVDLLHLRETPVGRLSLGARQRLSLGRVLVHNPQVLLLDEPVSGLDPVARMEVREILRELAGMGKTVLISSHNLADLSDLVARLVILRKGKCLFAGSIEALRREVVPGRALELELESDRDRARACLLAMEGVTGVSVLDGGALLVTLANGKVSAADISRLLVLAGFGLKRLFPREPDLEEAYLRITRDTRE